SHPWCPFMFCPLSSPRLRASASQIGFFPDPRSSASIRGKVLGYSDTARIANMTVLLRETCAGGCVFLSSSCILIFLSIAARRTNEGKELFGLIWRNSVFYGRCGRFPERLCQRTQAVCLRGGAGHQ